MLSQERHFSKNCHSYGNIFLGVGTEHEVQRKAVKKKMKEIMEKLLSVLPESLETKRERLQNAMVREALQNHMEGDLVLILRDDFSQSESCH